MEQYSLATWVAVAFFAVAAAAMILGALLRWSRLAPLPLEREDRFPRIRLGGHGCGLREERPLAEFLFEEGMLVDATPAARRLLRGLGLRAADQGALVALLARRFGGDLAARLAAIPPLSRLRLQPVTGGGELEATDEDGALRLTLHLPPEDDSLDRLRLEALEEEVGTLRELTEDSPYLVWRLDDAGSLAWANRAYLRLADAAAASGSASEGLQAWPARDLFEPPVEIEDGGMDVRRLPVMLRGRPAPSWWEVTTVRRGSGALRFAAGVDGLVEAEGARQAFVQSLSRAFAELNTGVAIFDRARRLHLFNPAFMDLTGLSAGFLSGRPSIASVLDRLRDAQVAPEPRDWGSWRGRIARLEAAAREGYSDTWTQPGGQTYRVSLRPQPDGALAFLVDDISDEVSLTRRFRSHIDTAQAVLDGSEEAVVAFTGAGTLTLSNRAYAALWGDLPGLSDADLSGESARWEEVAGPSPLWDTLRAASGYGPGRQAAEGVLRLPDGRYLRARAQPLSQGGMAARFTVIETGRERPAPPKRSRDAAPGPAWAEPLPTPRAGGGRLGAAAPNASGDPSDPEPPGFPPDAPAERPAFASRRPRPSTRRRA